MGATPKPIRDKDEHPAGAGHYDLDDGVLVWVKPKPKAEPKAD